MTSGQHGGPRHPAHPSRLCSAAAGAAGGFAGQLCHRRGELKVVIFPGGRRSGPAAGSGAAPLPDQASG
jgi:hypothetical protein